MPISAVTPYQLKFAELQRDVSAAQAHLLLAPAFGILSIGLLNRGKAATATTIYDSNNKSVTLSSRTLFDTAVTNTVMGYFVGGGWAFGLIENDQFRVQSTSYSNYMNTPSGQTVVVAYIGADGKTYHKNLAVGKDIPAFKDLPLVDQYACQHDLAMEQAREAQLSRINSGSISYTVDSHGVITYDTVQLTADQKKADLDLYNRCKSITFADLKSSDYPTQGLYAQAQLLQFQEMMTVKFVLGVQLNAAIKSGLASIGADIPLSKKLQLLELSGIYADVADSADMMKVFGGSTPEEARANMKTAIKLADAQTFVDNFSMVGDIVGSSLGKILAGNNFIQGILYSSFIGEFGKQLATYIAGGQVLTNNIVNAGTNAAMKVSPGTQFANRLGNAAIGSVSSLLMTELGNALGLKGFGAELVDTAGSSLLSKAITNVLTSDATHLFDGFHPSTIGNGFSSNTGFAPGGAATLVASAVGSFLGAKLGALIYSPQTQSGAALATIGSAVGSWALGTTGIGTAGGVAGLGGSVASALGLGNSGFVLNFIAPGIGALVGFVLGAIIGDLFGSSKPRIPTASAQSVLQIPYANYQVANITSANGGSTNPVVDMAQTAANVLNGIFAQVAGNPAPLFVANTASPTQVYGYTGGQLWLKEGGTWATQINVATEDQAVDQGVLWALPQSQVIGGNIFLKRAIQTTQATSVTSLMGDLQVASDFSFYEQNTALINGYITQAYSTLSTDQQNYYAANKGLIDQIDMSGLASLNASQLATYNANQATINAIVSALQAQSIANPWIIALQRANELGLQNFNRSDFFGGLYGFLQSFGLNGMNGIDLSTLSIGWDGTNLTLTMPAGAGAGVFSTLPQANATGNAVTIGNFAGIMGYANWSGQATGGQQVLNAAGSGAALNINLSRTVGSYGYSGGVFGYYTYNLNDQNDIVIGGNGGNYIVGGAGNSWIQGGSGNNYLQGGSGTDVLVGGSGHNMLVGGANGSIFVGSSGDNAVDDWSGQVTTVAGQNIVNFGGMWAKGGNNTFVAGSGNNHAWGNSGADLYIANQSSLVQYFDGAAGSNTVSFQRYTSAVNANLNNLNYGWIWDGAPVDQLTPISGQTIQTVNVQNLIGSSYNDTLETGPSGGVLEGGGGADTLIGGGGVTTVSYQHSAAGVYVSLATQPNNLVVDPLFQNVAQSWNNGWMSVGGIGATIVPETDQQVRVLRHKTTANVPLGVEMDTAGSGPVSLMTPVVAGQSYIVGANIASSGDAHADIALLWYNSSGGFLYGSNAVDFFQGGSFANGPAGALTVGGVLVAPVGAAYCAFDVAAFGAGGSPINVAVSNPLISLAPSGMSPLGKNLAPDPFFQNITQTWLNGWMSMGGVASTMKVELGGGRNKGTKASNIGKRAGGNGDGYWL